MARRGRPPVEITLTGIERRQLQSWARRHSTAQNVAMRSKIVLLCEDASLTGTEIAGKVGCNPATVSKSEATFSPWSDAFSNALSACARLEQACRRRLCLARWRRREQALIVLGFLVGPGGVSIFT